MDETGRLARPITVLPMAEQGDYASTLATPLRSPKIHPKPHSPQVEQQVWRQIS